MARGAAGYAPASAPSGGPLNEEVPMGARACQSRWAAAGLGVALLLSGCSGSSTSAAPSPTTALPAASTSQLACDGLEVSAVDAVPGDWVLAQYVVLRAPEGTDFSVTMTADAPARVELGDSPTTRSPRFETGGWDVEEATVTTDPASDLDPAVLLEAVRRTGGDLSSLDGGSLWVDNVGTGFSYRLGGSVGAEGTVVYSGAREVAVTFTGECAGPAGDPVPVTGTARLFDLGEVAPVACGQPVEPGSLAEAAAEFCTTD